MPLRVTQGMLNTQLLRNLNGNMTRMDKLQNQLSTGRRINKPSDDPVGISFSMRYRSELGTNDQYQRNVDAAVSFLDYTDTMLDQTGQVLQRARELAVQAANGTNSAESLDAMKTEVNQLYEQLTNIGNSQFNGKYVFNGQKTDEKPFPDPDDAANSITDSGEIKFEIGAGVQIAMNKTATQIFGPSGAKNNAFQILKDLSAVLKPGGSTTIQNAIGLMDERMSMLLGARSDVGAKTNRIQLAEDRLKDININLQSLQSKTEDADMSLVITNLKMEENVYQASLSAGTKVIVPSLVDFLH
ncbi:flagellar hook-associated protein FlgL [Paenibacillus roseipurpureus]|uniref:Flagellar hook-associated protein FlgL n=1 Tax=Paenibacillus roseopurpureus TaxID=2918901 RepID=A0AA96RMU7_9BACL|nr:flagellar hook-associated protein FlgL [Paenibacillus sp. MBLB1832]WNR44692.1 flagellar hook-associated protein FlgL [Paenibacillus sp. MBLB1832]